MNFIKFFSFWRKLKNADFLHVLRLILSNIRGFFWSHVVLLFGKRITIGRSLRLFAFPRLAYISGNIDIGCNVSMGRVFISVAPNSHLRIGDRCSINDYSLIVSNYGVSIGQNVMIAELVSIRDFDHAFDRVDVIMREQGFTGAPVVIEDDVWIARGVVILKGVRIGRGAVIGANAVVNKNIPPLAVAVGVPARVVKIRKKPE